MSKWIAAAGGLALGVFAYVGGTGHADAQPAKPRSVAHATVSTTPANGGIAVDVTSHGCTITSQAGQTRVSTTPTSVGPGLTAMFLPGTGRNFCAVESKRTNVTCTFGETGQPICRPMPSRDIF